MSSVALPQTLTGYVLYNAADEDLTIDPILEWRSPTGANAVLTGLHQNAKFWHEITFETKFPIEQNDSSPPPHRYAFIAIPGFSKIIVLSANRKISRYVERNILRRQYKQELKGVPFVIDKILESCASDECDYVVTSLVGRRGPNSTDVRTMTLYGPDVVGSATFAKERDFYNFTSCGLKRRHSSELVDDLDSDHDWFSWTEERELLRVGNDGFVSTRITSLNQTKEFVRTIRFLLREDLVHPEVPLKPGRGIT